ncbi:MAG: hypothetical protein ABFS21_09670 [Actinomycetota bacterium]
MTTPDQRVRDALHAEADLVRDPIHRAQPDQKRHLTPMAGLLTAAAVAVAVVALIGVPMFLFGGNTSPDPTMIGAAPGVSTTTATTQPPAVQPATPMILEDPPHLILEAEGWGMVRHFEDSYQAHRSGAPLVFRPAGADIGTTTLAAAVFERSETIGWSAGEGAERIELDGRVVSIKADSILQSGHLAGVEFDEGTLVVVRGFEVDRERFAEAAAQVTLTSDGGPVVVPPPGFERVELPAPYAGAVTYRESTYEGPEGARAEVRIWSGTAADFEVQVLNRGIDGRSVRPTTIDGAPAVIAYHSDSLERVFVVGGDDEYVIEIDLNPLFGNATDADLDAILAQIRKVDLATFEAAMPEGSVASGEVSGVVDEMLADVPLPPGFDTSFLSATGDRYHVGANVVGNVACAWIEQWIEATAEGDVKRAEEAAAALATSHDWSILREMQQQGAYPEVLWEYADAVAGDGTVMGGRILTVEESYAQALGCSGG